MVAQNYDNFMENNAFFNSVNQKLSFLERNFQEIQAFVDQKFDQIEGDIDTLESRINNLR